MENDEELVRQREFADQLRCVLLEGGCDNGSTAAASATTTPFPEQLVKEVLMSFTNCPLFLKNPTSESHEVSDVRFRDTSMSEVTEESNCKSSTVKERGVCHKRSFAGCTKAQDGLCISRGGGRRCQRPGCAKGAQRSTLFCMAHGGGMRCAYYGCTKGAQGSTMFCKAHGGGKRCSFAGCTKGAEGSTPLCKAHGGGKRCLFNGGGICPKSIQGGTNFCVAHGGGRRCASLGCTKSARGRTEFCVGHGGGRRCTFEGCLKGAQGSTDLCKAHGGGKRCSWGDGNCEEFARGKSGLCAAHCSLVQEREMNKGPVLFPGLVPAASTACSSFENNNSSSGVSAVSDSYGSMEHMPKDSTLHPRRC